MTSLPTIYKTTSTGAIQQWNIEIDGNKYRTVSGQKDGKKTTSEWTTCQGKNIGKANETSPEEQAMSEAVAKRRKKLEQDYVESLDLLGDNETAYVEPMLAKIHGEHLKKVDYSNGVYAQPKLDGIRCIARKDGLWTRKGKPILAVPHIFNALKPLFEKDPSLVFDGELYASQFKSDFDSLTSIVRKLKPTDEDIERGRQMEYWVYDLVSKDKFSERTDKIYRLLSGFNPFVVIVETHKIENDEYLDDLYERWLEEGFEGQMVRLDAPYENKRTHNLLKRKEFIDSEYTIVDIGEGLGNWSGAAGFMTLTDGSVTFNSNIKRSYETCVELLNNKSDYIGSSATCRFQNLTPSGIPRFPRVVDYAREKFE